MTKVVGVHFRNNGRMYYFDPGMLEIHENDSVIVETSRGTEMADVCLGITEVDDDSIVQPLSTVLRIASAQDKADREANIAKEPAAYQIAQQKIEQHQLDMSLVSVEYAFNGAKIVFYFTADERVDFRDLVKDLASQFHTRIELRQIGVRDEAKLLGGLGPCGRPICCKEFLDDFRPVSIKMAKEQNLSLSPTKISGLCGRLMCCLQYEQCCYEEMKHLMPKVGKEVQTPDGTGIAVENNAITEKTRVKLISEDGSYDFKWYHYTELSKPGDPVPERREEPKPEGEAADVQDSADAADQPAVNSDIAFGQAYAAQRRANNGRRPMPQRVKPVQRQRPLGEDAANGTASAKEQAKDQSKNASTKEQSQSRQVRPDRRDYKKPQPQESASKAADQQPAADSAAEGQQSANRPYDPNRRTYHRRRRTFTPHGNGGGNGSAPTGNGGSGSNE